jgi:hypothetical protein
MNRSVAALAAFLAAAAVPSARAQTLAGCASITNTDGMKIVVSSVECSRADGSRVELTETESYDLQFELASRLGNLCAGSHGVLCSARRPKPDGSSFPQEYVEGLDGRDVLLEVWGRVDEEQAAPGKLYRTDLRIMVFPVRLHPLGGVEPAPFLHALQFPRTEHADAMDALKETLFGPEFETYVLLGHAVKSFRNRRWDEAQSFLSRSRLTFESASANGRLAPTLTNPENVRAYLDGLEREIAKGAESDPTYRGEIVLVSGALEGSP